ncbi:hypothetical protein ACWFR4_48275, partial [Streptomyces sp. NPDC055140]
HQARADRGPAVGERQQRPDRHPPLTRAMFAYTSTTELPSGAQVLKTMAVRKGNLVVMLVGAPALVDRHMKTAVGKLAAGS